MIYSNSVLNGFNGTIFAYGQTGSGKTYSMTGCSDEYKNRGIIPRCLQEVFQFTNKSPDKYTIFITYMEIYNEVGYDLLNPHHQASRLEDLPRVSLLDDGKGEFHLRNLSMLPVMTEQEAMRLLFLGDTNRTIAETPMNAYSSRSHCIFTIYVTSNQAGNQKKLRRSKLNLIDLAGSERICKSGISGTTLHEAKNINLSLYYLEQVIKALSKSKKTHIPFRNSMMTFMLKESLSGNFITAMIATISMCGKNFEETVSTCKFSQRVALVDTEAAINEEINPQCEIEMLRDQVMALRKELSNSTSNNVPKNMMSCEDLVLEYLKSGQIAEDIVLNTSEILRCFKILLESQESKKSLERPASVCQDNYKEIIKQKDEEIEILTKLVSRPTSNLTKVHSKRDSLTSVETELFEVFITEDDKTKLYELEGKLKEKYHHAEEIATFIETCQSNILRIRGKLELGIGDGIYFFKLEKDLKSQQEMYRKSIEELQNLKVETDFLEHGLKQEQLHLEKKFKSWFYDRGDLVQRSEVFDCINQPTPRDVERKSKKKSESMKFDLNDRQDALRKHQESSKFAPSNKKVVSTVGRPCKMLLDDNSDDDNIPEKDTSTSKASLIMTSLTQHDSSRSEVVVKPVARNSAFLDTDRTDFLEFMNTIPLTGDYDVDIEIVKFYRSKF